VIGLLVQGLTLGVSAGVTPGPFQAYLLAHTLAHGWRKTLPASAAPLLTDAIVVPVVLIALTRLPDSFLSVIQIIGAGFILFLAWGAFRAFRDARTIDPAEITASDAAQRGFIKGALMNVLNPNPYIFWGTILGPIVLRAWGESPANATGFVITFYAAFIGFTAALVMLFGLASARGPQVVRVMQGIAALALLIFGVYQLWTGASHLLVNKG
jgi:threonine/homoserine/homoserine lactone efflux protein